MSRTFDAIILGQGLAGTALAWHMRWAGMKVLVIDRESPVTSSKIAAGLITPITGQKLIRSWRYPELWPTAVAFYKKVESKTTTRFFRRVPMVRLFANDSEAALFQSKGASGEFEGVVRHPVPLVDDTWLNADRGGFEMVDGGQLNVCDYLEASRYSFLNDSSYLSSDIDVPREIVLEETGVSIPRLNLTSHRIFFCQGIDAIHNPWFRDVRFKPAKGEILTIRISGLTEQRVVHRGIWLAPLGGDLFKAGATYDWKRLDSTPTLAGQDEILRNLCQFLRRPFEVVSHNAAVRPIHRNQHPVLGCHPEHPQLGFFNGLGSKGSLQAPFFANQFVEHLNGRGTIDAAVDLAHKLESVSRRASVSGKDLRTGLSAVGREKRPMNIPLTQQAQEMIRRVVRNGESSIDATAGNGHDTHFLAELSGTAGTVYAFDVQQSALDSTARRLADANLHNVILIKRCHGQLAESIPADLQGRIAAVMFNLGYLPHGDKSVTTTVESTLHGIAAATRVLRYEGLLTILAYTGHDGGSSESEAVEKFLDTLPASEFSVSQVGSQPGRLPGPRLFVVQRLSFDEKSTILVPASRTVASINVVQGQDCQIE